MPAPSSSASSSSVTSSPPPPPRVPTTTRRPGSANATAAAYDPLLQRSGRGGSSPWGRVRPVSTDVSRSSSAGGAAAAAAATPRGVGGGGGRGLLQRHSATAARSPSLVPSRPHPRSGLRGTPRRSQSATLAIAEAEAVRAARDFSMDMYRELHQRKFKSTSEELDFLRKDFVASRRTLALLHEDNVRLERELLARATEVAEVHAKLEQELREADQHQQHRTHVNSGGERAEAEAEHRRRYGSSSLWAEGAVVGGGGAAEPTAALPLRSGDGTAAEEGGEVGQHSPKQQDLQQQSARARETSLADKPPSSGSARSTPRPSQVSARGSLALFAATASSVRGGGNRRSTSIASSRRADAEQHELIRDLRANLARRDTSLNELQMELGALQHAKNAHEAEQRQEQSALAEAKKERDALQARLTAQEEQHASLSAELSEQQTKYDALAKEKDDLQRRLTTAELLYEHAGGPAVGGVGAGAADRLHAQEDALREQLRLYRNKWQAAEDQTELLHQRISQLQRQLVTGTDSGTRRTGETLLRSSAGEAAAPAALSGGAVVQEAKHTADLAALRRQHQEQLQMHVEETQRLQRRLDRAQENAAFHEDQLRQQRQEDARLHHEEVQALQTQLRTAQSELVRAQEDREHLARQLRRSTEQETTVEVLRGQVDQLKQRLGEVGAELAQVHGREKESSLQLQRERLVRAKAGHTVEELQEALERERMESQYMREEVKLMRERLGVQEAASAGTAGAAGLPRPPLPFPFTSPPFPGAPASCDAAEAAGTAAPQQQQRQSTGLAAAGRGSAMHNEDALTGDAAALSSEVKGYVGLMRVNTALQRRIAELEACLQAYAASAAGKAAEAVVDAPAPAPPAPIERAPPVAATQLEAGLSTALQLQATFAAKWADAEQERRQLLADNKTLADGVELLQRHLRRYRDKQRQHQRRATSRRSVRCDDDGGVEGDSDGDNESSHREAGRASTGHRAASRGSSRLRSRSRSKPRESRVRHRLKAAQARDHEAVMRDAAAEKKKHKSARAAPQEAWDACIACKACQAASSKADTPVVVAQPAAPAAVPPPAVAAPPPPPPPPQQQHHAPACCQCHPPYSLEWITQLSHSAAQEQALVASPSSPPAYVLVRSQLAVRSPPTDAHVDADAGSPPAPSPSTAGQPQPQPTAQLSPRRHRVYGSMLPPVYYPSLLTRSRA